ncbi:MAG: nicotinamide-nucleotide amidohydrolase family protein [Candidatus Thermoplasmatota archaeon]|jgi:nicotinamide-nucleotide amidase
MTRAGAVPGPDPASLLARLERDGLKVAVAESCTGGLLGGRITDAPGASRAFLGGVIAYSNDAKVNRLGVDRALFADGHGAVSAAVAEAMARGVLGKFGADVALAVSGIAGPGGGTPEKPVGLVWLAAVGPRDLVSVHRLKCEGDRAAVREQAVVEALRLLEKNLDEAERVKLTPGSA